MLSLQDKFVSCDAYEWVKMILSVKLWGEDTINHWVVNSSIVNKSIKLLLLQQIFGVLWCIEIDPLLLKEDLEFED